MYFEFQKSEKSESGYFLIGFSGSKNLGAFTLNRDRNLERGVGNMLLKNFIPIGYTDLPYFYYSTFEKFGFDVKGKCDNFTSYFSNYPLNDLPTVHRRFYEPIPVAKDNLHNVVTLLKNTQKRILAEDIDCKFRHLFRGQLKIDQTKLMIEREEIKLWNLEKKMSANFLDIALTDNQCNSIYLDMLAKARSITVEEVIKEIQHKINTVDRTTMYFAKCQEHIDKIIDKLETPDEVLEFDLLSQVREYHNANHNEYFDALELIGHTMPIQTSNIFGSPEISQMFIDSSVEKTKISQSDSVEITAKDLKDVDLVADKKIKKPEKRKSVKA